MSDQPASEQPATDAGSTKPAGQGVDDDELTEQVSDQTSSDLEVEDAFERDSDGAGSGTEAAKAGPDDFA